MFEALDHPCDGRSGLPHAVLTSESVCHVSSLPGELVDLFREKPWLNPAFHLVPEKFRERLTHLQGEELACPAQDDEQVDEPVDEPVD